MQAEMLKAHGAAYTPTPSWSHDPMDTGDGVSSPAKKRKTATGAPRGRSGRNMPADYGSPPPAARTRSRSRNREIDPDIIAQAEAYAKRAYEQGKQEMAQAHSREQQTLRQQEETLRQQQEYLVRMREELEQQQRSVQTAQQQQARREEEERQAVERANEQAARNANQWRAAEAAAQRNAAASHASQDAGHVAEDSVNDPREHAARVMHQVDQHYGEDGGGKTGASNCLPCLSIGGGAL